MATNDKIIRRSIPLASADFDSIKASLKEFLKERPELSDYDFDGSVTNLLLDELSLNTHINAFYLNMVGNEAFLKTAIRRDSVVARAEALNYTPKTIRSSTTEVFVELFSGSTPDYIEIPKYSLFTAAATGVGYSFYNTDSVRVIPDVNGRYKFDGMEIVEGKFMTHRFLVDANILEKGIIIPNANVDSTRFDISIAENSISTNFVTQELSKNIVTVDSESEVYFVRELDGLLNVYFGDGIIGKKPIIGSVIRVIYPISSGEAANGVATFSLATALPGVTSSNVVASAPSFGGATAESIESIKLNAPRFAETQNRGVTPYDYDALIRSEFPNIDDIIVWGGEDNDPPAYGKVFISINPSNGYYMTTTEKNKVVSFLKSKRVVSITPVVIDPEYIFVKTNIVVDYNKTVTDKSAGQIENLVANRVLAYSSSAISRFDKTLRKSILSRIVDNSDVSIVSNTMEMTMEKRTFPVLNKKNQIIFSFSNPVLENSFVSSKFTLNGAEGCYLKSNGTKIAIYRNVGTSILTVSENVGTINYQTGDITTIALEIDAIPQVVSQYDSTTGQYFISMSAVPGQDDIETNKKQIVEIIECIVEAVPVTNSDI